MAFESVFSIVGIIVLALAVIALTVNYLSLSARLKELTDTVMLGPIQGRRGGMDPYDDMYDLPPRRTTNSMYAQERRTETRRAPGPQRGSAPQRTNIPQRTGAPQRASMAPRANAQQRAYTSEYRNNRVASNYDYPVNNVQEMEPYNSQSYSQPQVAQQPMNQSYNTSDFMQTDSYNDDEFFETYRDRDEDSHYLRGRGRPTIPFGADKSIVDRRRDSYVGSVVDSDYDPDSIDFTRVQGYQRAGGRY